MKRLLVSLSLTLAAAPAAAKDSQLIRFGRFGDVTVYKPKTPPTHAAIFLSGDGGWNSGVVDMAKMLVEKEFLVIGVDVPKFLASYNNDKGKIKCAYPPGDLQMLSQYVEKKLGIKRYLVPIVVGYSSGATLAYAALAEAPAGTFEGAVSLGFCSDINIRKPLCKGDGLESKPLPKGKGYDLKPFPRLPDPWIALHGKIDQVCDIKATRLFVSKTGNGKIVELDKVGHGFGIKKRWQTAYEQAVRDITAAAFVARSKGAAKPSHATASTGATPAVPTADVDLPVVEVRSPVETQETPYMALLVSGDGGWAGLDREVSTALSDAGVPVVGLDSLQYFWTEKTPDAAGSDAQKLIANYMKEWGKTKFVAIGYSFGADVLPFFLTRLTPALKDQMAAVALISPSSKATFEFRVTDWFGGESSDVKTYPTLPELAKLKDRTMLCFYGTEDKTALCPQLKAQSTVIGLEGSHRLGDAADDIADAILKRVGVAVPE